ncbi:conjugal transfer protein TraX [Anaerofustis stercorihominis]|uniref:TraX family protein n=1 Tax=Anaerofustis stercorihominis TaxID=214853 RepID=UPI0021089CFE|nr:TraX family protein [Anaerofustis stercorihominis]MCQ4795370.1 conjugal transfer protein TraX [Anaerofustis stercorihominis]
MKQKRANTISLSGNMLKLIAMITMIIDHIGGVILETGVMQYQNEAVNTAIMATPWGNLMNTITFMTRMIGRISFPIFCFLIVEGFLHTKNVKKYLLRVGLFAFISQIPFSMALFNTYFDFSYLNVLFTFFIGIIMLIFLRKFEKDYLMQGVIVALSCAFAYLFKTDYDFIGILFIATFYLLRGDKNKILMMLILSVLCIYESKVFLYSAVLSLIPIHFYNGSRGKVNLKYVFYWFYPAHLLVFTLIRIFVCGIPLY